MSEAKRVDGTIVSGACLTLRWAQDAAGRFPAREFFLALSSADQKKMMALFARLANDGRISSRQNFKKLGQRAPGRGKEFFEFKKFKIRFLGVFQPGAFLVCHGLTKKSDDLRPAEIERAVRILEEHEKRQERAHEFQRLRADGTVFGRGSAPSAPGRGDRRSD